MNAKLEPHTITLHRILIQETASKHWTQKTTTYANINPDLGLRKAQNVAGLNQLMVHNPADFDIWILKTAIKFFF